MDKKRAAEWFTALVHNNILPECTHHKDTACFTHACIPIQTRGLARLQYPYSLRYRSELHSLLLCACPVASLHQVLVNTDNRNELKGHNLKRLQLEQVFESIVEFGFLFSYNIAEFSPVQYENAPFEV